MTLVDVRDPVRVNVNVTRRCNLTCWYCHSSSGPSYRGPELSEQAWRAVLEGAEALGVLEVTLTGGEPLMWRGLAAAMKASREELGWTSLEILTNAMVLTPRRVETLAAGKVGRVCVSLDGVADVHEATRGAGSYAKVLDGIARVREAVDNVTVISVLDSTNADQWPELTAELVERGVRQHHLSPVCFSGHAMNGYQGLSAEQFEATRATADALASQLPAGFTLRFNDGLVHPPATRRVSISTLVEVAKGLHLQVMPDGAVRSAVRVWGRSWRGDEGLGNVNRTPLASIVAESKQLRAAHFADRFALEDELRDKFHLGADNNSITADVEVVRAVEDGRRHIDVRSDPGRRSLLDEHGLIRDDVEALRTCAAEVAADPAGHRLRVDGDIGMMFNTTSFEVTLLSVDEAAAFEALYGVPTRWAA